MKLSVICLSILMSLVAHGGSSDAKVMKIILETGKAVGACTSNFCAAKLSNVHCDVYEDVSAASIMNECTGQNFVIASRADASEIFNLISKSVPVGGNMDFVRSVTAKSLVCTTEGKAGSEICWAE